MNINDILKGFVKNEVGKQRFYSEVGKIVSIDEENMLCEVSFISSNANKDVRLGSVISADDTAKAGSSLIIVPKVDTFVLVTFINETTGFISLFSEVDKILYQIGDRYIQINEDFIEIDGDGDNMVRFSELETAYNQLKREYDDVVTKLNAVINTLQTWVVAPQDGGLALQVASAALQTAATSTGDITPAKIDEVKTS